LNSLHLANIYSLCVSVACLSGMLKTKVGYLDKKDKEI